MKINATKSWLFAALLSTTGLCVSGTVGADDSDLNRTNDAVGKAKLMIQLLQPEQQPQGKPNSPYSNNPFGKGGSAFFTSGNSGANVTSAIRKAAEAVRDAKGDEAKSDAEKKLAELLSKSYDDDMVQREHELKQIEERLTKLRGLLDRRRTKKQEIIDLQTKVALNEAEGLGFYDNDRPTKGNSFGYALPRIDGGTGTLSVEASSDSAPTITAPAAPKAPKAPKAAPR
jgi:hypothetical protein